MLRKIFILAAITVFIADDALGELPGISYPFHASCKIQWKWPETKCPEVLGAVLSQIAKWNNTNCSTGEKCRYALKSKSSDKIEATHTTPVKHYVDDLTFAFSTMGEGCEVSGSSSSETWYAVLDYGTNYCNLHNLITGASLDKVTGYQESTNNSKCTQYTSANCEKY